jgi:hypothetical protein
MAILVDEYLCEYESKFETAVVHESVDPGVIFDEKTRGQKSRETVPLTTTSGNEADGEQEFENILLYFRFAQKHSL